MRRLQVVAGILGGLSLLLAGCEGDSSEPDAVADTTPDADSRTPDVPDAMPDTTPDADSRTPDVPDAVPDTTPDADSRTPDVPEPDATSDATPDNGSDAPDGSEPDAVADTTPDADPDAPDGSEPDAAADTFFISCDLPRYDLTALTAVTATPRAGCVLGEGDSVTLEEVLVSQLPLEPDAQVYVRGSFELASVPAAGIQLTVYWGSVLDCTGGVVHQPGGEFELWGTVTALSEGTGIETIGVDLSYDLSSSDCRYDLAH